MDAIGVSRIGGSLESGSKMAGTKGVLEGGICDIMVRWRLERRDDQ